MGKKLDTALTKLRTEALKRKRAKDGVKKNRQKRKSNG